MPTPATVEPPTPENVHLYRAACLVWKRAWRDELRRNDGNHKLANPHAPEHAAGLAVRELAPEMTYNEACTLGHKAVAWCGLPTIPAAARRGSHRPGCLPPSSADAGPEVDLTELFRIKHPILPAPMDIVAVLGDLWRNQI